MRKKHSHQGLDGRYNWLPDFVYGGIDGAVTTFAVVAGVAGAELSIPILLILGFANIFADGFSMATGKYLSDKAYREQYEKIQKTEFRHLQEFTAGEIEEVRQILRKYGFKGEELECATKTIISHPKGWVDLMMRNEFNMTSENIRPIRGAIITFISFALIGFIPMAAYVFNPLLNLDANSIFILTSISTGLALFTVGAVKSKFIMRHWALSGLEVAFFGGVAASLAYLVGVILKGIV